MSHKTGLFKTTIRMIRARPVDVAEEMIIDKNGEKLFGLFGDWHIWDENGYEYFLNKYSFRTRFQPWNERAIIMVANKSTKKKIKEIVK